MLFHFHNFYEKNKRRLKIDSSEKIKNSLLNNLEKYSELNYILYCLIKN